ncbi:hypothetical protein AB0H76_13070 [Nocardia sp. NPDC050712]|uniref:hypothetical protein n=1 Tax=Nocardia sp. NPDC050712 TaxID=3155518 RepID=UPI0033D64543
MGDFGTDIQLTYSVQISVPGAYESCWWQVSNSGSPAQVAAAMNELAARLARDLHYPIRRDRRLRSLFRCELRTPDGVMIECPQGPAPIHHLPAVLRGLALSVGSMPFRACTL